MPWCHPWLMPRPSSSWRFRSTRKAIEWTGTDKRFTAKHIRRLHRRAHLVSLRARRVTACSTYTIPLQIPKGENRREGV